MILYSDLIGIGLFEHHGYHTVQVMQVAKQMGLSSIDDEFILYIEWSTGGASGGSCWDNAEEFFSGEKNPGFPIFEELLEEANISFEDFLELFNRYRYTSYRSDSGYYGNYEDFECEFFFLSQVFTFLCERGYSLPESQTLYYVSK